MQDNKQIFTSSIYVCKFMSWCTVVQETNDAHIPKHMYLRPHDAIM